MDKKKNTLRVNESKEFLGATGAIYYVQYLYSTVQRVHIIIYAYCYCFSTDTQNS